MGFGDRWIPGDGRVWESYTAVIVYRAANFLRAEQPIPVHDSRVHSSTYVADRMGRGWSEGREREYSLSKSSSVNRLRVNFQMTKEMRPINATPPDTDRPMIVDLLMPVDFAPLVSAPEEELLAGALLDEEPVGVAVITIVVSAPLASVVSTVL